jgi:hypothetical protein
MAIISGGIVAIFYTGRKVTMSYSIAQETKDFEDVILDEFGETITYVPDSGPQKSIKAIIPRRSNGSINLQGASFSPGRTKLEIKISQGVTLGMANVVKGKDKVKFKLEPDDLHERVLTVSSANAEYGAWVLGLL